MKQSFQAVTVATCRDVDIHCHVILRKPKEASFHAKEEDELLHP